MKCGPAKLRKLLYLAALSVRTHNINFKKYFLRKVAEGKNKRLVLNNIENKLLKIVFAVVSSGVAYTENYKSINPTLLKTACLSHNIQNDGEGRRERSSLFA
jgi:hypothetical protein